MAEMPNMRRILAMLLPIILPSTKSALPEAAAFKLTANSGAPVAKATTVKPITTDEIRHFVPKRSTPFKNNSAPVISAARPTIKNMTIIKIANEKIQLKDAEFLTLLFRSISYLLIGIWKILSFDFFLLSFLIL